MFERDGLPDITPGEILNYRLGFNVYTSVISERQAWAYSGDLGVLVPGSQSPYGKFTYPYELASGDWLFQEDENRSGNGDFEISGSYKMTLMGPQK